MSKALTQKDAGTSLSTSRIKIAIGGKNARDSNGQADPFSFLCYLQTRGELAVEKAQKPEWFVAVKYSRDVQRMRADLGIPRSHCFLLQMEPEVVLPSNYSPATLRDFKMAIRVGGDPIRFAPTLPWPQVWPKSLEFLRGNQLERLDRIVIVNANKVSLIRGELYSLRREALHSELEIDLYGMGWGDTNLKRTGTFLKAFAHAILNGRIPDLRGIRNWFGRYDKWKGAIGDGYSVSKIEQKYRVMSKYSYALVIENSTEYLSEKLFDALFSGCIPIYVGPQIENFGIPGDIVIQAEPTLESIYEAISKAKIVDKEDFRRRILAFLQDEQTVQTWDYRAVYGKALDLISGPS